MGFHPARIDRTVPVRVRPAGRADIQSRRAHAPIFRTTPMTLVGNGKTLFLRENLQVLHLVVLRMEQYPVAFEENALDRGLVLDERHADLAVVQHRLFFDHDQVAVQNAGFDHAVAPDVEREQFVLAVEYLVHVQVTGDVFLGQVAGLWYAPDLYVLLRNDPPVLPRSSNR